MSENDKIQGIEQQTLIRIGLILLIAILLIGSILDGVLSGQYELNSGILLLIGFISGFVMVVSTVYLTGNQPNLIEMLLLYLIIIGTLYSVFNLVGISIQSDVSLPETQPGEGTTTRTPTSDPSTTDPTQRDTTTPVTTTQQDQLMGNILNIVRQVVALIFAISILGFIIYYVLNRGQLDPEITLAKEQPYAQSEHQSNRNIIQYYIKANKIIDRLKGVAPKWYTPTFYADHVRDSPGPPLSSYLDRLTELYEKSRFADYRMSEEKVKEAKELYKDIETKVEDLIQQFQEENQN